MNSFLKKLFLFTYFSISLCYSQDVKNQFDIKKDSLLNSGVELLIEYKMGSGDNMITLTATDCIDFETKYLFWIIKNNCFSQKYSECTFIEKNKLTDCQRLMAVYNNLDDIKESEVLPVTMENILNLCTKIVGTTMYILKVTIFINQSENRLGK
jgi:hypothetical protein